MNFKFSQLKNQYRLLQLPGDKMKKPLGSFKVIIFGILLNLIFFGALIPITWSADIVAAKANDAFRNETTDIDDMFSYIYNPVFIAFLFCGISLITALMIARWSKNARVRMKKQKTMFKKSMEKLRLLVENSDDGILIVKKLKFLYANKKVYDMMGLSHTADVSDNLVDFIHPDDLGIVLENYEKSILSRGEEINFEVRILKPDKSTLWVHNRFVPSIWDEEPVNLVFMRDITAKKKLERDLHHAQRLEAIGALSGGIAHEFNNILTSIIGNAEVALMDLDDFDYGKKEFERIQESGYRASGLVRQILTITREHTLETEPLYLSPVIKEALKLLRSTLPTNIKIVEKIDKGLDLIRADSIQIYQVFMNLCTNAKQAMEAVESPCLEVELKNESFGDDDPRVSNGLKPGSYVTISVKDNGTGIALDVENKIFEPYFSTNENKGGTGLGLTTTLGIVKQFEGFISFQTQVGKGTCFVIYFPVYKKEKVFVKKQEEIPLSQIEGKILFVDDEKEITMIAKKMFENLGFSVTTANSGREALQYFTMSPDFFDVLITDLAMPEMTGELLVKEVTKIRPGFPVVMCTGHSDTFDKNSAKALGVVEYVSKPYNLKELSVVASKYINKVIAA